MCVGHEIMLSGTLALSWPPPACTWRNFRHPLPFGMHSEEKDRRKGLLFNAVCDKGRMRIRKHELYGSKPRQQWWN